MSNNELKEHDESVLMVEGDNSDENFFSIPEKDVTRCIMIWYVGTSCYEHDKINC